MDYMDLLQTAATSNPQCGFPLEVMQNVASNWIV